MQPQIPTLTSWSQFQTEFTNHTLNNKFFNFRLNSTVQLKVLISNFKVQKELTFLIFNSILPNQRLMEIPN